MAASFAIPRVPAGVGGRILDDWAAEQNSLVEPRVVEEEINSLPDNTHRLLSPINVKYERLDGGYTASFVQANIAVSGITKSEARDALIDEILDAFDDWSADESALGVGPRQQLVILKNYIARC